jgi:hypothetical protein
MPLKRSSRRDVLHRRGGNGEPMKNRCIQPWEVPVLRCQSDRRLDRKKREAESSGLRYRPVS